MQIGLFHVLALISMITAYIGLRGLARYRFNAIVDTIPFKPEAVYAIDRRSPTVAMVYLRKGHKLSGMILRDSPESLSAIIRELKTRNPAIRSNEAGETRFVLAARETPSYLSMKSERT